MHSQQAAAGAACATVDRLTKSSVVCEPLVNEPAELPMLSHAKSSDCNLVWQAFWKTSEIYAYLYFKLRRKEVNR